MAVSSKDIEILWKQYSEDEVNKGISVAQFFESNVNDHFSVRSFKM